MSKLFIFGFLVLCLFLAACSNSSPHKEKIISEERKSGFFIDSNTRQIVLKNIDTPVNPLIQARLIMTYYQNDQQKDVLFINGQNIPYAALYHYDNDTLKISLVSPLGINRGFEIDVFRDSAYVSFIWSPRHATESFKLSRNDSTYINDINIPCKFYLMLNKKDYNKEDPLFGYVEASTNSFFRKTDSSDTKDSLEFKAWFNAMSMQ
jgi:hypothetical protein